LNWEDAETCKIVAEEWKDCLDQMESSVKYKNCFQKNERDERKREFQRSNQQDTNFAVYCNSFVYTPAKKQKAHFSVKIPKLF
jgi:hypothetical protein